MPLYPEGYSDPYEAFYSKVRWLKSNPKSYRVYRYSARTAQKISVEMFGNRLYFISVPTTLKIRFNEPENDVIEIGKAVAFHTDFYRAYLEWDATPDDNPIEFVAGFDFEAKELGNLELDITDQTYVATPLTIAEDSKIMGTYDVSGDGLLMLDYKSDIDGIINIYTGFDGSVFYGKKSYPVTAGTPDSKSITLENRWVQVEFEKAVPGTPQTELYLSVRSKKV